MHLFLFTNSAQRELVSICTQSIRNCNKLSLPYILGLNGEIFLMTQTFFCKEEQRMAKERWRGEEERRRVEEERRRVETERQRIEEERRRQSSLSSFSSSSSSYSSRGSSSRTSSSRGSSTRPLGKQACPVELQDRERACSCPGVRPSSLFQPQRSAQNVS